MLIVAGRRQFDPQMIVGAEGVPGTRHEAWLCCICTFIHCHVVIHLHKSQTQFPLYSWLLVMQSIYKLIPLLTVIAARGTRWTSLGKWCINIWTHVFAKTMTIYILKYTLFPPNIYSSSASKLAEMANNLIVVHYVMLFEICSYITADTNFACNQKVLQ